jgi:hypothetical protein
MGEIAPALTHSACVVAGPSGAAEQGQVLPRCVHARGALIYARRRRRLPHDVSRWRLARVVAELSALKPLCPVASRSTVRNPSRESSFGVRAGRASGTSSFGSQALQDTLKVLKERVGATRRPAPTAPRLVPTPPEDSIDRESAVESLAGGCPPPRRSSRIRYWVDKNDSRAWPAA